ncbi:hypothetical protein [Cryptosporangium sp. NPDC051539]|uniref:hypothetical protein n=1 Tax=Cryptosporangium sp. NPDC051539 TaxID=3363962 RepID=UPI0037BA9F66
MKLTEADLRGIPAANIKVSRDEFVALWTASEEMHEQLKGADWGVWGVACACRWLADATSRRLDGRRHMSKSPATRREKRAFPELITAELVAGETMLASKRPSPVVVSQREYYEAAVATLRWAWMRNVPAPYHWLSQASALRTDLAQHS